MVRFLIGSKFWSAVLNRERRLLKGGAYYDLSIDGTAFIRRRRLFETWHKKKELWNSLIFVTQISTHKINKLNKYNKNK